jgi:holo-[acyl-carrier protein] synthase
VILGIGSDLTDIRRIEKTLARFGERFEQRVFTATERAKANRRGVAGPKAKAATLAKRFAAKEACSKALGTGLHGIRWREMEVVNLPSGKPTLQLTGDALLRLLKMTPPGYTAQIDLTMTDDYPLAQAFVVVSANAVIQSPPGGS